MTDTPVRIFVSSPADVDHERAVVKDIIERLAGEYLPYFELRAILWEEEALTADRTFQAGLTQPQDCDIVLVILWTRLGSPLPQEPYRGMTGTEWEFINAVEASASAGTPEVLVYKKTTPKLIDITDAALAREAIEDRRRLEDFFQSHFFFEDNTFRRAFRSFDNAAVFRELVETQLRKLLNRRISAERRATAGPLQWRGSPFRPDRPFDLSDERVFTGREQEVRQLIQRLEQLASARASLLLLTGPSGSGKTSLVRAGLLPRLTRPFQFAEIETVRACLIDPGTRPAEPLAAIATALCEPTVLGEPLAGFGLDVEALSRLLHHEPQLAAQQLARAIAVSAPAATSPGGARLLLALDPLDQALEPADPAILRPLAEALRALAEAAPIWVLGVVRSDAVSAISQMPALQPLLDRHGWTEVSPPSPSRIRQVVEIPARIAGIDLDADGSGERDLVELVEADASGVRVWPPLVQAVLDRAYESARARDALNDAGELRITATDYRAGGGIEQQVLTRADRVWKDLDGPSQSALPRLGRALISIEGGAGGRATPRYGSLAILRHDPDCARLLERLIAARLVVAEGRRDPLSNIRCEPPDYRLRAELAAIWRQTRSDWRRRWRRLISGRQRAARDPLAAEPRGAGPDATPAGDTISPARNDTAADEARQDWRDYRAVASFSHPALVTRWTPLRDWLAQPENRRLLARRFQLDRQAQLWKRTNCNREYLLRDAGCAEADALVAAHGDELEPLEQEFIAQSKAHLALLRRRSYLVRLVGIVLAALVLLSALSAGLAYRAYTDAQANLSRSKLNEANLSITRGNTPQAVALAVSAGADLPQRAVQTLGLAFSSNRLIAMAPSISPQPDAPRVPAFSAEGSHLASFLPGRGPTLLELTHGHFEPILDLTKGDLGLHTLVFGPDTQAFGIGAGGVWSLPATAGAEADYRCGAAPGHSFALDAARERLALSREHGDGKHGLCVLDLTRRGRIVLERRLDDGPIRSLSFAPGGDALLTASADGRSRLLDLETGAIRLSLPADGPIGRPFNRAVFDAHGERIAIAAADERIRLYTRTGEPIAELSSARIGGREFQMHRSAVRDVAFDPSGAFLVAADDEGQIVRWTLTGAGSEDPGRAGQRTAERSLIFDQAVVLNSHRLSAGTVRIIQPPARSDLGEGLVLSASLDGTAKLAGLQTGKEIAVLGHDAAISAAGFHADGARVATFSARDHSARLWSVTPVSRLAYTLRHPDHVWYVDMASAPAPIARDGDALLLATAGWDGGVRVWRYGRDDSSTGPEPWLMLVDAARKRPVRQVRFSPSGERLASAHYDGTARIVDLVEKRTDCVLQVTASTTGEVYNALIGPGGDWAVTSSNDRSAPVRLYSTVTCEPLQTGDALAHGQSPVEAVALHALGDRTLIATGDQAGIVRIIERSADGLWHRRCRAEASVGAVGDIAFSPDGRQLGIAGEADHSALIDLELAASPKQARAAGESQQRRDGCGQLTELRGHSGRIYSIAFAPDSAQVVTASLDKTARLWTRTGEPIAILVGHQDRIYRAEYSPDGAWVLTGSRDRSIRIWKRPQHERATVAVLSTFLPLEADYGGVANAIFSPDGHYVAGAYWEDAAILWRLWAEDSEHPVDDSGDWGQDRGDLALVQEAYRFTRENQVPAPDPAVQTADE